MSDFDNLGTIIRQRRKQAGMTQLQLSLHSGVSLRQIQRLEHGEYGMSLKLLKKILTVLNLKWTIS